MEILSDILCDTRKKLGLSLEDLEKKTHITKQYIIALENGDFEKLPGEIYTKGFLKRISVTLKLDPDEIIELYKRNKLSEDTAPYKELIKKNDKKIVVRRLVPLVLVFLIIGLLVFLVFIIQPPFIPFFNKEKFVTGGNFNDSNVNKTKTIVEDKVRISVRSGDNIHFTPVGVTANMRFTRIASTIRLKLNDKDISFSKSSPYIDDLNGNGTMDFRLTLLSITEDTATIEIERVDEGFIPDTADDDNAENNDPNFSANDERQGIRPYVGEDVRTADDIVYILENVPQEEINIRVVAKQIVYVRYFLDSNPPKTKTLTSGQTLQLLANDTIIFSAANVGHLTIEVNGKKVILGRVGEVVNKSIKWSKLPNDETRFNLIIEDVN